MNVYLLGQMYSVPQFHLWHCVYGMLLQRRWSDSRPRSIGRTAARRTASVASTTTTTTTSDNKQYDCVRLPHTRTHTHTHNQAVPPADWVCPSWIRGKQTATAGEPKGAIPFPTPPQTFPRTRPGRPAIGMMLVMCVAAGKLARFAEAAQPVHAVSGRQMMFWRWPRRG